MSEKAINGVVEVGNSAQVRVEGPTLQKHVVQVICRP